MAYLIAVPLLFLCAILESSILSGIHFLDGKPDLVLIIVVAWGVAGRPREAIGWGLIGGLALDLLAGLPFGTTAVALIIVTYLVSLTAGHFWEAHFLMPLGAMLVGSTIFHFFSLAVLLLLGRSFDLNFAITRIILPSTFLNLLMILPVTHLTQNVHENLFPSEINL